MKQTYNSPVFFMDAYNSQYSAFIIEPSTWHLSSFVDDLTFPELLDITSIPFPLKSGTRKAPFTYNRLWTYIHIEDNYQYLPFAFVKNVISGQLFIRHGTTIEHLVCNCKPINIRAIDVTGHEFMYCMRCGNHIKHKTKDKIKALAKQGRTIGNQGRRHDYPDNYLQYDHLSKLRLERFAQAKANIDARNKMSGS